MLIKREPRWRLPYSAITPESVVLRQRDVLGRKALSGRQALLGRRAFLTGAAALAVAAAYDQSDAETEALIPERQFTPSPPVNPAYADAGRAVTPEGVNTTYNNFYEFASHKRIRRAAQALDTAGWTLEVSGLCANPQTYDVDTLIQDVALEERVTRHRCVEAWSMVAPWIGFPLREILRRAEPDASARYVRFESFHDPAVAPGQREVWAPWPYVEGLTMEEAANELAFLAVGAYGKVLHKQFGAPLRLHLPWKYGFKSIKSIVKISFVEARPVSFWERYAAREYGFWANVNPEAPHPRWSQATERVLGSDERIPTQLFNGYAEEVAHLYRGLEATETLWR